MRRKQTKTIIIIIALIMVLSMILSLLYPIIGTATDAGDGNSSVTTTDASGGNPVSTPADQAGDVNTSSEDLTSTMLTSGGPSTNPVKTAIDSAASKVPTTNENGEPLDEATLGAAMEKARRDAMANVPIDTNQVTTWPQGPATTSPSVCLMDIDTGAVLYAKDMEGAYYPASITKVLTALIACETAKPDDKVVFSEDAVGTNFEPGSASMGFKAGEEITMDQALRCMLVASANEVANAIAETVGGSNAGFAEMMNKKAQELGCTHTHFVTPSGLHDENHYTSAHDMAIISAAAYRNDWCREVLCLQNYDRPLTNLNPDETWIQSNNHKMFRDTDYYYQYATGGKTGGTDQAHTTLVTYAEKDGLRLVCVVLYTDGVEAYTNTATLFDYGLQKFTNMQIAENDTSGHFLRIDDGLVTLPLGRAFSDLDDAVVVDRDRGLGEVSYNYHGWFVGKTDVAVTAEYLQELYPDQDIEYTEVAQQAAQELDVQNGIVTPPDASEEAAKESKGFFERFLDLGASPLLPILIIAGIALIAMLIFMFFLRLVRRRKKRRRP